VETTLILCNWKYWRSLRDMTRIAYNSL
jgi:hypothetical protein